MKEKSERLWERHPGGRPRLFDSPEELWNAAVEYFEWVEANPLRESKVFAYQGEITTAELPKMRAMTIEGMCLHMGIVKQTWMNYKGYPEFLDITTRIEHVIRQQKFEGAAADLLNQQIIARDLGLRDQVGVSDPEGGPVQTRSTIDVSSLSQETLTELINARRAVSD